MFLKDYIEQYSDDINKSFVLLGKKFGAKPRAVQAWYYHQRYPNVENARIIVKKTGGAVDYEGIYAPYTQSKTK